MTSDQNMTQIRRDLALLKWMVGLNIVGTLGPIVVKLLGGAA